MKIRQAKLSDLGAIDALLNENNLPSEDCRDHIDHFIILENNGKIVGIGALEYHGIYGLLRSIVISSEFRNKGLGKQIIRKIINQARDGGIITLYLLTEGAPEYFIAAGIHTIEPC